MTKTYESVGYVRNKHTGDIHKLVEDNVGNRYVAISYPVSGRAVLMPDYDQKLFLPIDLDAGCKFHIETEDEVGTLVSYLESDDRFYLLMMERKQCVWVHIDHLSYASDDKTISPSGGVRVPTACIN